MKWSIKYIVSALPFLFTACSGDWLDLDPSTSVTSDNAIQSLEDAKTALNGIYRIASEHSYYGDNYLYYADCRGEDVQARIDKGPGRRVSPYYLFNVAADDAFNITRVWNQPYIVIHQANSLIEKIDNGSVQTSDTQEIARIKAEALAMRGLALFDLTRLFGMPYTLDNGASLGVPIEIKTELPTHQPSRNTVAECYNHLYYADCRGEDVQARIDKGPGRRVSPYYLFNVAADDAFNITRVWNQPYIVIHQANSLIEKIDNGSVQTSDTQEIARIKAEALAMRGLALFDLTRLFGMPYTLDNGASLGVPIEIKTELPTHQPSRNTVAECYNQVIKDLTEALPNLVTTKFDGHQNVWSVKALLSRIYLYMNDNENALKYAQEVINNGDLYTLFTHDEYTSVWGKDFNSESLFEFYFTLTEPSGGSGGEGAPMVYADNVKDWNNLVLTKDFLDLLGEDPDDVRHALCRLPQKPDEDILPTGSTGHPKYLTKYPGKTGDVLTGNPQDNDLCIIRLSEIYLNAAEAAFKLGKRSEALGYLNQIVSRANPNKSVSDSELSLERILKERRKELVGEGHAFFDYMRNNIPVIRKGGWHLPQLPTDAQVINASDPRVALPIPQSEIDANPNIVQNKR